MLPPFNNLFILIILIFFLLTFFLIGLLIYKRRISNKKPLPVELYFSDGSKLQYQPGTKEYLTFVALANHMYSGSEMNDMLSCRIIRRSHFQYEKLTNSITKEEKLNQS